MKTFFTVVIFFHFWEKLFACVYLTVSSISPGYLEANWFCEEIVRTISIYNEDPGQDSELRPLTKINIVDHSKGYQKTSLIFNPEPFPGNWSREDFEPRDRDDELCLYWYLVEFEGRPSYTDCYKIYPAWMYKNKMKLRHLSLPQMFIPGTHNSGTDAMKTMKKRSLSNLDDFILTQDQSVWNQLVYGIRFIDLRVGFYPQATNTNSRFWINHDLLRIQPLFPVLKDIVEFSRASPDEIIILDFHRFPAGFRRKNSIDIHRELIRLIGNELKGLAIPRPSNQAKLKLEEIWNTDKRIVVSYSEENLVFEWRSGAVWIRNLFIHTVKYVCLPFAETPWLWNSVSQRWGNKQTAEALEKFLDTTFRDVASRKLWAAMAELTPTPLQFLGNGSLRNMADTVNRNLTKWFLERRNWTSRANIVAPDFFLGTNIINVAIEENLRKANEMEKA